MDVSYLFAGLGMIILIGFMGTLFFERTKIPDVLILIFMGLMIGPILTDYANLGLVDEQMREALDFIAPSFAALALVIILFDGGLNLHLEKTMKKMGLAILHTGLCFIGSVVITALICLYILNMDIFIGLLLGCIIGGTSGAVVIPIMMRSCSKEDTKILLTLESVLTDVLCIVGALIFIEVLRGSTLDTGALIQRLLSQFILAAVIAFAFGVLWLVILKKMEGKPFAFMVTIAALLVLYAFTEFIEVSGAIAALVFGLVLSNKDEIARILKVQGSFVVDEHIKQFHSEVSFLVRTFFFVYLGITFSFTLGTFDNVASFLPTWISWHPLLVLGLLLILIYSGILLVRYITSTVVCHVHKDSKDDKSYIYSMMPRGLAAAVLASLPFTIPEFSSNFVNGVLVPLEEQTEYYLMMASHENTFMNVAFMIIIMTVISTTIGVSVIERRRVATGACPPDQETGGDWAVKSPTYRKALESESKTPKANAVAKDGPKPWNAPLPPPPSQSPARKAPAQPVSKKPQKKAPAEPVTQSPPPRKEPVRAQPIKPAQTRAQAPVSKPKASGTHPLVKRAAESEKAVPKKPVEKKKGAQ